MSKIGVLIMYVVGIDTAKHHHEAAILDESRKLILKKLKFDNSHQDYDKLMNLWLYPINFPYQKTVHFVRRGQIFIF